MDKPRPYDLNPEKMVALLRVAKADEVEVGQQPTRAHLAEVLEFHLSQPMPLRGTVCRYATAIPELITNALYVCDDVSTGQLLKTPETDLEELKEIKAVYRQSSQRAALPEDRTVAVAIYYGAISRALVSHGEKISGFSYNQLLESLTMLLEKNWIPGFLMKLYDQAMAICRRRQDSDS